MRIQTVISDLTEQQWDSVHRNVRTSYEFGPNDLRVCVTFIRTGAAGEKLERHIEMLMTTYVGLLLVLRVQDLGSTLKAAMAMLTPDDSELPSDYVGQHDVTQDVDHDEFPPKGYGC
jgi:hypothetical protein